MMITLGSVKISRYFEMIALTVKKQPYISRCLPLGG
jgi:hypothetical protein